MIDSQAWLFFWSTTFKSAERAVHLYFEPLLKVFSLVPRFNNRGRSDLDASSITHQPSEISHEPPRKQGGPLSFTRGHRLGIRQLRELRRRVQERHDCAAGKLRAESRTAIETDLRRKAVPVTLFLLDVLFVAVLVFLEGSLHWLGGFPVLDKIMERVGALLTIALLVQVFIVLVGATTKLFFNSWSDLHELHGGPKPSLGIILAATCALCAGIGLCLALYLPREKPVSNQLVTVTPEELRHLPAVFRLQRFTRGSEKSSQRFVVAPDVTEIELQTPVAYASFKTFTLILDGQPSQGYQVRNGELSLMVDRQAMPSGKHTLVVRERHKSSSRTDEQIFTFTINASR